MSRKLLTAAISAVLAVTAISLLSPAGAGEGPNEFTVNKVVEGPVPDGAVFVVEVVCDSLIAGSPEGLPTATVRFDQDGNPLDPNSFLVGLFQECTATETVTNGAQVSYDCEVSQVIEGGDVNCIGDQTVLYGEVVDAEGVVTVTNTFEDPPPPDVEPDDDTPDAAPDVVDATPSFTG